jgi:hypothetical protein
VTAADINATCNEEGGSLSKGAFATWVRSFRDKRTKAERAAAEALEAPPSFSILTAFKWMPSLRTYEGALRDAGLADDVLQELTDEDIFDAVADALPSAPMAHKRAAVAVIVKEKGKARASGAAAPIKRRIGEAGDGSSDPSPADGNGAS